MKQYLFTALLWVGPMSTSFAHEGELYLGDIPGWQLMGLVVLIGLVFVVVKLIKERGLPGPRHSNSEHSRPENSNKSYSNKKT